MTWPPHLQTKFPNPKNNITAALSDYFRWAKGNWGVADFLSQCTEDEIPQWLRDCCAKLRELAEPVADETSASASNNLEGAKASDSATSAE